eukprot:1481876-Alexandrium_andersonii.AAC.1
MCQWGGGMTFGMCSHAGFGMATSFGFAGGGQGIGGFATGGCAARALGCPIGKGVGVAAFGGEVAAAFGGE